MTRFKIEMFTFKNGNEDDEIVSRTYKKEFKSAKKAIEYGKRYAKGVKFYAFEVFETHNLDVVYRLNYEGLEEYPMLG